MNALREKIVQEIKEKDLTISSVERAAGLSKDVLRNFIRGKVKEPKVDKINTVAKILSIDISAFLNPEALEEQRETAATCHRLLLKKCLQAIDDVLSEKDMQASLEDLFVLMNNVYEYHQETPDAPINKQFVRWYLDKHKN